MATQHWEEGQSTEKDPGKRGSEYINQEREKEGSKECRKEGKERKWRKKAEEGGKGAKKQNSTSEPLLPVDQEFWVTNLKILVTAAVLSNSFSTAQGWGTDVLWYVLQTRL